MQIKNIKLRGTTWRSWSVGGKIAGALAAMALVFTPIFAVLQIGQPSSALSGTTYLGGMQDGSDLLRIAVNNDGGTNPQRFNPNGNCNLTPGNTGSCWTREYYAGNGNGLVLYANGQVMFWGGNNSANFGSKSGDVNISVGHSAFVGSTEKINRTWTGINDADGIVLQETISLVRGSQEYTRAVTIVNNTGAELSDVRLIVGGDTYFAGDDSGYTGYGAGGNMVYVYKDSEHGAMFFSGSTATPADKYFAGNFSSGVAHAKTYANLPNTVSGSAYEVDTSYYLQWGDGSQDIAASGQLTIGMSESITSESTTQIQVAAPANRAATADSTEVFNFTVLGLGADTLTLSDLTATSSHGWNVQVTPTSGSLEFGDILAVTATVTIPAGAEPNTIDTITLSVPFSGATSGTETATVRMIVDPQPPTIVSVSPTVGMATGGNNVTITGTNFNELLTVLIGDTEAEVVSVTPTAFTVKAPAHAAGVVDVVIDGEFVDAVTFENAYEYVSGSFVDGNRHELGTDSELVYQTSRDVALVESVTIAGHMFTIEELGQALSGDTTGTIVTIPAELLNGLTVGTYAIEIAYADGFDVGDNFEIYEQQQLNVPNTGTVKGDTSKTVAFSVLPIAAITLVAFVVLHKVVKVRNGRVRFNK
ncbi:MAG: IPT/TIG domain-containing protein [Candidatus Nomurabacteria bacterium]|jgi:hypothetical protein|nr:IPT/TIG domain-containing protein [Candidatus Nomurabacteria bacterium]